MAVALVNGQVLTDAQFEPVTVVIEGDRIVAVGRDIPLGPQNAPLGVDEETRREVHRTVHNRPALGAQSSVLDHSALRLLKRVFHIMIGWRRRAVPYRRLAPWLVFA